MGQSRPLLVYFRLFQISQFNILIKALMACFRLEPRAAGWKVQTNPLSYLWRAAPQYTNLEIELLPPSDHLPLYIEGVA